MTLAEKMIKLQDYQGEDRIVSADEFRGILEQMPTPAKIHTDLSSLDNVCDGFEGGELVAISGPRKAGKTLLAQTLTMDFASQGIPCLWFTYELTPHQFMKRIPPQFCFHLPMRLKSHDLEWLEDRIVEGVVKTGTQAVFIDHLHFLFDIARSRNSSIEIGSIIRRLKSIAIELNIVIFLMAHTQMIPQGKEELDDSVIRDSSFVSQESDTAFIVWRVKNTENKSCLKVCYHRRTGTWEKTIRLIKVEGRLRELLD